VSALPVDHTEPRENRTPGSEAVEQVVGLLPGMDLSTLESGAALLTRVDRKYVVPVSTFERLVTSLDGWRALEIDDRRSFAYASTYFDTDDLYTFRAHLQRRRRRFKVRVRRYVDSGACMLEVKRKGLRGVTVKERTPHPEWRQTDLGESGESFVADVLQGHAPLPPGPLRAVVTTSNRRATLASLTTRARLTVDTDLVCGWSGDHTQLRPGFVLLESKAEGAYSTVDRRLRALGQRPVSISKYCIGVTSLGLDVPSNPWRRTLRRYFESPHS
jgi:VTC domain